MTQKLPEGWQPTTEWEGDPRRLSPDAPDRGGWEDLESLLRQLDMDSLLGHSATLDLYSALLIVRGVRDNAPGREQIPDWLYGRALEVVVGITLADLPA